MENQIEEVSQLSTTFHQIDEKIVKEFSTLYEKMDKNTQEVSQLNTTFYEVDEKVAGGLSRLLEKVAKQEEVIPELEKANSDNLRAIDSLRTLVVQLVSDVGQIRSAGCRVPCPVQCAAPPPIPERNNHEEPATLHRFTSQ